jgi:hypothetical protein
LTVPPKTDGGTTEEGSLVAPKTGKAKTADGGSPIPAGSSQPDKFDWSSILSDSEDIDPSAFYMKDLFNKNIEPAMTDEQRWKRHLARKAFRNSARGLKHKRKQGDTDLETDTDCEEPTKKPKLDDSEKTKLQDYANKEYFDA